jgi:hypothetical protein
MTFVVWLACVLTFVFVFVELSVVRVVFELGLGITLVTFVRSELIFVLFFV